jgi:ABC-type nitrate/sulfonate/bicarbonate transport system permease component
MEDLELAGTGSTPGITDSLMRNKSDKNPKQLRERLITVGIVVSFLGVWEILSRLRLISVVVFPAPSLIVKSLAVDLVKGVYTKDILISISRMLSGILFGGSSGLILGLIMGWSKKVRRILDPIIAMLHPIPKMTLLPMALIIFGLGETSRVVMVSISAFFPMLVNTMVGVRQINPTYYEVVENYGSSTLDTFRKVVLPGSLPFIMSGFRLSFKSALTTTIGIEMVFGNTGLGSFLWLAWETMRMWNLYAVIIIIAIIGAGTTWALEVLKKYLLPWHHENRAT